MSRIVRTIAPALILTSLAWTAVPTASWAEEHQRGPTGYCVKVTAHWLSPPHPHVGDGISWLVTWTNCGRSIYLKSIHIAKGPCGAPLGRGEGHWRLRAGESIGLQSVVFPACKGTYRITNKAFRRGVRLDRMSRYLRVRP